MATFRRPSGANRRAFTLVELLVTITIITMLAGMVLGGLSMARTSAREMKTKATIAKLDEIVMRMYAGYGNRRVPINTSGLNRVEAANAKNTSLADLIRMEMPQTFTEISTGPTSTYGLQQPALQRAYQAYRTARPGTANVNESAACLFMIVSIANPRDMEHFSPDEIGGFDINRPNFFVDAWGNPIAFLRVPSGFADSDIQDTAKPETLLPLVVSAGPDGDLGLNQPRDFPSEPAKWGAPDGSGAHYDNIHNHRLEIR